MKGIHFSSMGHSAPRSMVDEDGVEHIQKRLELLPEEAIYLIERGTMFCWKESDIRLEGLGGVPMTVQQAYSEMIAKEGLTLEKFQVRLTLTEIFSVPLLKCQSRSTLT
jgi:tRNA-splicing endonuclease subunit Sen54